MEFRELAVFEKIYGGYSWYRGLLSLDDNGRYVFNYTEDSRNQEQPIVGIPCVGAPVVSDSLFPVLQQRIMKDTRPDFSDYLAKIGLPEEEHTDWLQLAYSGGHRYGDNLWVTPLPCREVDGSMVARFWVEPTDEVLSSRMFSNLQPGDRLQIRWVGDAAYSIRTHNETMIAPIPISLSLWALRSMHGASNVTVDHVNHGECAKHMKLAVKAVA